jgi:hypothetical protein
MMSIVFWPAVKVCAPRSRATVVLPVGVRRTSRDPAGTLTNDADAAPAVTFAIVTVLSGAREGNVVVYDNRRLARAREDARAREGTPRNARLRARIGRRSGSRRLSSGR